MKHLIIFALLLCVAVPVLHTGCDNTTNPNEVDTLVIVNKDTIFVYDTTVSIIYDTLIFIDSIIVLDSIFSFDSLIITVLDTVFFKDTVWVIDSIFVIDTIYLETSLPVKGLILHLPFYGNANDESGNNLNGTVNGATLCPDRYGNANNAYSFDGTNDFIAVDSIGFYNTHSISCWAKTKVDNLNDCRITDYGQRVSALYGIGQTTDFRYHVYAGDSTMITNKFKMQKGVWHHFVTVFNIDTMTYYVDGNFIGGNIIPGNASETNSAFHLGIEDGVRYPFEGCIDDVRVYKRALNEIEIKTLSRELK